MDASTTPLLRPKARLLIGATLLVAALVVANSWYRGDGELVGYGVWPLRTYVLTLPPVSANSDVTAMDVRGLPSGGKRFRLRARVSADEDLVCTQLADEARLRVLGRDGEVLVEKTGLLNALVVRIWANAIDWPLPTEWMPSFHYKDPRLRNKAVPVVPGVDSIPERSCEFWTMEVAQSAIKTIEVQLRSDAPKHQLEVSLVRGAI